MLVLGIVLFVLIALSWGATLLLKFALWPAIVFTVLVVLLFVGLLVFRHLRAASRAAALERELLKQAADQAARVRPDQRPEILALREQMKAGIAALKRSKLGAKGGRSALYALPWYMFVGPPAAGKTTAIERSGLAFAGGKTGTSKVRGTAGTRNCDWWFTRDAILLDTAGRFATQDDDRDEWRAFLDLLKRHRPHRPVDGLVVALSIADVMSAPEAQIEEVAQQLRERIDELMVQLEMVVPIYVLFTKADLIAGFVEFWGDYGKNQRGQAWGATFALDDERLSEPAHAFEAEFDHLLRVLPARMVERLGREQVPQVRARILQFPVEFESLRAPLARFMDELCRPNPYSETPIVRGFYFSSGTQSGAPIERVLANMVRGFALQVAHTPAGANAQPQSYFVTDLFEKIIFPDRDVATRSGSRVKRHLRTQAIVAGIVSLCVLVFLLPGMVSFARSRELIEDTVQDVEEARRLESTGNASAGLGAVDVLHRRVKVLEAAEEEYTIAGFWGPRTAAPLRPRVQELYLARLRTVLEGPVREQLTGEVRVIGNLVNTDVANFREAYDRLKLYLMLGNPQRRLDPAWAAPRLAEVWGRASQGEADRNKLKAHTEYYVKKLAATPSWAWQLDLPAVTQAQGRLSQLPLDDLRYSWLAEATRDVPPIRAEKIFFGTSAQYFSAQGNAEVPGMFTKLGWAQVKSLLGTDEASVKIDSWVLGQELELSAGSEREDGLEQHYFRRYVQAWSAFLSALQVSAPTDLPSALDELRSLSEADGPYTRLFRTLKENVQLDVDDPSLKAKLIAKGKQLVDKAVDKAIPGPSASAGAPPERPISPVEQHFKPLIKFGFGDAPAEGNAAPSGLNQYLAQLTSLEVALSQLSEENDEPTLEFGKELSRTAASVKRLLGGLDTTTRIMLEPLLMNPIRGSQEGVSNATHDALGDDWTQAVWNHWNTKLAPRFPFAPVSVDASVAELADFIRPQTGMLWAFFDKNLSPYLEPSGGGFVPKNAATPVNFRGDFLHQCLARGKQISDALFGVGGAAAPPSVPFTVNIHPAGRNISEITLMIDGKRTVYRNEPERWQPATWPGDGDKKGAVLKVKGAGFTEEIPREGEFGLFRLLAVGGLKPSDPNKPGVFKATWALSRAGEPPVTIEIKPTKSAHPFGAGYFSAMKCPAVIMSGGLGGR
jgi:type VI secretion system protein ImpL